MKSPFIHTFWQVVQLGGWQEVPLGQQGWVPQPQAGPQPLLRQVRQVPLPDHAQQQGRNRWKYNCDNLDFRQKGNTGIIIFLAPGGPGSPFLWFCSIFNYSIHVNTWMVSHPSYLTYECLQLGLTVVDWNLNTYVTHFRKKIFFYNKNTQQYFCSSSTTIGWPQLRTTGDELAVLAAR